MRPHNFPLIITGMHRSGTSLIAGILQRAGVHIGDSLLEPDELNPRGFYEDVDFYQFHQRVLYRCGQPTPYVEPDFAYTPVPSEIDTAQELIQKKAGHSLWGWKDPRTCLFLEFWRQRLPQARYLFVYRHPLEVLLSFIRRNEIHTIGLLEALTGWHTYNIRIEAFYQQHSGACVLGHTYALLEQPDKFRQIAAQKLALNLTFDEEIVASQYHRRELRHVPLTAEVESILRKIQPACMELYDRLDTLADLSEVKPARPEQPAALPPVIESVNSLSESLLPSSGRGLLFLLIDLLAPDLLDAYFKGHSRQVIQLFEDRGRLAGEVQALKAWIDKQEAHVQSMQEYIAKQAEVYQNQKEWIEKQEEQIARQAEAIGNLTARLDAIYNSSLWRIGRRLADSPVGNLVRKMAGSSHSRGPSTGSQ